MSSILRLTFLYVWSNCSLVLANIRRHAAHWDCTQHDKVCNWISGFLFIIQYFQNNASSSTVLCHIIFILTITVTYSWESNFYSVCIIKLSLLRLSLLRFTSDSPTDQRNPFSGDYCVHACVCVSRFHLRGFERWERASSHNPLAGEQWDEPHPPSLAQGLEASSKSCNSAVMSCTVPWQVHFARRGKGGLLSMP